MPQHCAASGCEAADV